jgi:fumarate reductase flavoprotein subunit
MGDITTVDVLVIGAGLAGYCAAIEAAALGAAVLLIEKQSTVGGSTILSGGSFAFAGTDEQHAAGLEDSAATLEADLLKVGDQANDPALVRAYSDNQADTYRWLKRIGVRFSDVFVAGGQSVPRSIRTAPAELMRLLHAAAQATGRVELRLSRGAARLIREPATGTVQGAIVATADGGRQHIHARRGIVLASGGFSRSEELLHLFAPAQRLAQRMGGAGNTGDGLRMAWALGGGMRDMGYIKGTFGSHPSATPETYKPLLAIYRGAIAVNRHGKRFVNEAISYKKIGDACLLQDGALAYQVFDQTTFERSEADIPAFDIRDAHAQGRLEQADTLQALAQRIGVDADALRDTVSRYNRDAADGRDTEFGRSGLSNEDFGRLQPLETPPFYAYPCTSVVLATYCGLAVDAAMRVRDVYGEPIEGLYAAGEIVGGLHGAAYMSGSANGKAAIFGRLAGRAVSARAPLGETQPTSG